MHLIDYFCNGFQLYTVCAIVLCYTQSFLFASTLWGLLYCCNYNFWFHEEFELEFHNKLKWARQFVHFSLVGHYLMMLYIWDNRFLPITFTIQFMLCFGYGFGAVTSQFKNESPILVAWHHQLCEAIYYAAPLFVMVFELYFKIHEYSELLCKQSLFTKPVFEKTRELLLVWFFCITIPWGFFSKDPFFNVFASFPFNSGCPVHAPVYKLMILLALVYVGHIFGSKLQYHFCRNEGFSS
jgi:hypothetical protein